MGTINPEREDEMFANLALDRQANIEVVLSSYQSIVSNGAQGKAYVTMPVTSGRRYYEVLDRYQVRTVEELEQKKPGALREEIIIPNIAEGKEIADKVSKLSGLPLVVPGVFEARRQRWSQDEYMSLWLRILSGQVQELYLSPGWEYSNGGAMEFTRGMMIQFRFVEGREDRIPVYDIDKKLVSIAEGAEKLAHAIQDLRRRGFNTSKLDGELELVAGIAMYLCDYLTSRREYAYHTDCVPNDFPAVVRAAQSVGIGTINFRPGW
jgi:hypothetical protein